ncbi:MAG: universal stress protein [Anaerolineae bacterium]|nr:universal stress protein [Anaerolineae bacterium]MDW8098769.1 universal stress protein [Anaerolineae bacterium]
MNDQERVWDIRRILVALDASPHSLAALEAAVELAAMLRAELLGLFVEDINLLRLGELSLAREVYAHSATASPIDSQHVERQLRTQAERARQALAERAERAQVRWAFRVTRGAVASEVLAAAAEADLITLGKVGWSVIGRRRLGATAQAIVSNASAPALISRQGARLGRSLLAVYDGSPAAQRALIMATNLARDPERSLTVLILTGRMDIAQEWQGQITAWLRARGLSARYRWQPGVTLSQLAQVIRAEGEGIVVLPRESPLWPDEVLAALLNEIECPVLLVR